MTSSQYRRTADLPVDHDHAAAFSDVAAVPAGFDSDSYQPLADGPDAGHPVGGGWEAWDHDGANAADWPGTHHVAHPGFDHFA